MNESIKRIWIFFFLILFCNSVFAYGYNPDRLYFADAENNSNGVIFDRGNGCKTDALTEKEVNALWDEILIKGFAADTLESNQGENKKRETLDKNQLIVAETDSKAGDIGAKTEIPSQKINPLEIPMLLGKTCTGSFDYGLNLKKTLRVGRCTDSENEPCYLTDPGQYRQNDMSNFLQETKVVGKDLIKGLKETVIKEDTNTSSSKEDLGAFSDMSSYELEKIEQSMISNDVNALDAETWDNVSEKIIGNTVFTRDGSFSVSMQTTCSGENCYINTYSLFDKMFNQYFSVDMVYTSATPFLFNGAAKIFNVPGVKNTVLKPINTLKKKGVIKEGGFLDVLTKDPALFVRDPFGRVNKAIKASKYARSDVDKFIEYNLAHTETISKNIDAYEINDFTNEMFDSVQDGMGKTSNFSKDMIVKNGKQLGNAQKRAATDIAQQYSDKFYASSALLKSKLADPLTSNAIKKYTSAISKGTNVDDILRNLTKQEYEALEDYIYTATRLSKAMENITSSKYAWKNSLYNTGPLNKRTAEINVGTYHRDLDLTKYMSLDGKTSNYLYDTVNLADGTTKIKDDVFGKELKLFEFDKGADSLTIKGASKSVATSNIKVTLKDGSVVTRQRLKAITSEIDRSNVIDLKNGISTIDKYKVANPEGYVSYFDYTGGKKILKEVKLSDIDTTNMGIPSEIKIYPNGAKESFVDDLVIRDEITGLEVKLKDLKDPNTGELIYGEGYFDLDPMELAAPVFVPPAGGDTIVKKIDDTAMRFNNVLEHMSNREWVSGRGRDALNQLMKNNNGAGFQRFLTRNPLSFGINFAYWEIKTGGNTLFGDTIGLTKWSAYQLPETYTALHIKHKENGTIYADSYIDFFANEGSDQGDLFMKYMNSMMFWSTSALKKVVDEIGSNWSETAVDKFRSITEGQIKRSKTDDIVLITNNISSGCNQSCTFTVGADYVEKETKNASLSIMELQKPDTNASLDTNASSDTNASANTNTTLDTNSSDYNITQFAKAKSANEPKNKVDYSSIKISTITPIEVTTNNYILENTSKESLKLGQTLITFSHHTDYDGTVAKQSTEKAVDLVEARDKEETCEQKVTNLNLMGIPIGKVIPKSFRNHRFVTGAIVAQKFAYMVFPGAGYFSSFIGPALVSDLPMQLLIMPEIHGCVDDQEGLYAHFFVSSQEEERLAKDSKTKVGEAIIDGTKKVEETVSKITSGTDLEKGVKAGSEEVKKYVEEKIIEDPIVQSTFNTGGGVNTDIEGQIFFIEIGPKARCMASGYNDKGVEVLKDKDTNIELTIDREKGEMTVKDENGNTKTIIGNDHKDFVRIIGDNLGIPAKVVPRSLSYIPIPNDSNPLFEIDAYGNLSVKNPDFFDCLRAGYEAQTGLTMNSNAKNLTEYLGTVTVTNDFNPNGAYTTSYLGTSIIAGNAGLPRKLASGNTAKMKILGDRTARLGPIDGNDQTIGINVSVQFQYGQLLYSEEAHAYIMWVQTTTETNGNDIASMKGEVKKTKATNGCDTEEIGINLNASPTKDDDQAKANVNKLNKAFEKVGPFQMFDTKTKTFIFYVSDPPECEQRLKIIDKETGEIYDKKIDSFEQTPNGISVKTADGQTHNLEFSSEDGVPRLTYNGEKDTLTSAQGKNGAFWFDPDTGNWYTTNGNLIPLNGAFKDGVSFGVDGNGKVVGTPGTNVFNIGSGGSGKGSGGFNIPLTPESKIMLILYIGIIMSGFVLIYMDRKRKTKK